MFPIPNFVGDRDRISGRCDRRLPKPWSQHGSDVLRVAKSRVREGLTEMQPVQLEGYVFGSKGVLGRCD
jgi:hypothetical protein